MSGESNPTQAGPERPQARKLNPKEVLANAHAAQKELSSTMWWLQTTSLARQLADLLPILLTIVVVVSVAVAVALMVLWISLPVLPSIVAIWQTKNAGQVEWRNFQAQGWERCLKVQNSTILREFWERENCDLTEIRQALPAWVDTLLETWKEATKQGLNTSLFMFNIVMPDIVTALKFLGLNAIIMLTLIVLCINLFGIYYVLTMFTAMFRTRV